MKAVITARRLHHGHYEAFRDAWTPKAIHPAVTWFLTLRTSADPDFVVSVAFLTADPVQLGAMRSEWGEAAVRRSQLIEPHVASTVIAGYFDLAVEAAGEATGDRLLVPLTERWLRPGTSGEFIEALQASMARQGRLPLGMTRGMALVSEIDPEHVVQFGIVSTDDPAAFRAGVRADRERMLEALAPYVESVGVDQTFDLVEQIHP